VSAGHGQDMSDSRPLVASLCGTFLKPEMQSVYRQVANLRRFRTVVLTEKRSHAGQFPFEPVVVMEKQVRPRPRGNFLLRFWFKHVVKQWPPPIPITKETKPYHPYDLPDLLARWQPALVHVYYGHKAVKYRPMLEAWGGPWLVSFHGVDVAKFFDQPGHAGEMMAVFASATLVLARSGSLLEKLRALGAPPDKLRLNRTPIPLDGFAECGRDDPPDGAFRLVQASRLVPKKGLFTTLEALRTVAAAFPRAKFVLCGDGPSRGRFERAVADAGLSAHVEVRGWLSQSDLLDCYRHAHLFLHPSERTESDDQEGVPNSMLEAMATGLPVVATWHGGIPEAVRDGQDGLLVPEKDPAALAAAIIGLLGDAARRRRLGQQAAAHVRDQFGLAAGIAALEDCYAEAIALTARPTGPDR